MNSRAQARSVLAFMLFAAACGFDSKRSNAGLEAPLQLEAGLKRSYSPELGKGINIAQTRTFLRCIKFPAFQAEAPTFGRRVVDEMSINSRRELNERMDISASLAAKGLWGSAEVGASFFKHVNLESDSEYWLVNAKYELLHESIDTSSDQFSLSPLAKNLLQTGGWKAFKEACGTQFLVGRTLGAQYSLLYEFSGNKEQRADRIKEYGKAEAFGLAATATFSRALERAQSEDRLRIHVEVFGGDDTISARATNPEELKQELSNLAKSLAHRHGTVLGWEAVGYEVFPEVLVAREMESSGQLDADAVDGALATFYQQFEVNLENIAALQGLLAGSSGEIPLRLYSARQVQRIEAALGELRAQNEQITLAAKACMTDGAAAACTAAFSAISPPALAPDQDFSTVAPWRLFTFPVKENLAFVDFMGVHPDGRARIFRTERFIFSNSAGITTVAPGQDGRNWPVVIGFGEVDDVGVVDVCTGRFAPKCHLRIGQKTGYSDADGPLMVLIMDMLDEDGFITAKYEFNSVSLER